MTTASPALPSPLLQTLAEQIRDCQAARRRGPQEVVSSGYAALDQRLPQRGLLRGTLVEWLDGVRASGATTLALAAARQACQEGQAFVVVDREGVFYPRAATGVGIELPGMIVVRPGNDEDENWAIDQALRCEGVGAVLCWPRKLDDHTFRRWQLAAEQSGALGLLVRKQQAEREPSWADLRLLVRPCGTPGSGRANRRLRIEVLRCHGAAVDEAIELEIGSLPYGQGWESRHETHRLPLAATLASATAGPGTAGAGQPAAGHL